ncbi:MULTISPECIES: hypothetical protein [unclassified Psychrobacillus]|uniref:hypothetical protein n=1 Tax=unclassified Psychrobacillus TaxID=2636677 RepID=UPI0030FC8EA7
MLVLSRKKGQSLWFNGKEMMIEGIKEGGRHDGKLKVNFTGENDPTRHLTEEVKEVIPGLCIGFVKGKGKQYRLLIEAGDMRVARTYEYVRMSA